MRPGRPTAQPLARPLPRTLPRALKCCAALSALRARSSLGTWRLVVWRFLQRAGTNREPAGWPHGQRSRPGWPGGGGGEPLASGAERTAQTTG